MYNSWYSGFNGEWNYGGEYGGVAYYTHGDGWYLKYFGSNDYGVSNGISSNQYYGGCDTLDITACTVGRWTGYSGSDASNTYVATCAPTPPPIPPPACVVITNAWSSNFNGEWNEAGTVNGLPYYSKGEYYLRYTNWASVYGFSDAPDDDSLYGYCGGQSDITACTAGSWTRYTGSWVSHSATSASACAVTNTPEPTRCVYICIVRWKRCCKSGFCI